MVHEKITSFVQSISEYDAESLIQRFSEQVPEGHNGLDAAEIVGKLETSLRALESAADSDVLRHVPMKILSDISSTLKNIQSDFQGNRSAGQTVPRIMNLESFLWDARLLAGQDHISTLLSDLGVAQSTIDEARRTKFDLETIRSQVKEVAVKIEEADGFLQKSKQVKTEIDQLHSESNSANEQSKELLGKIKSYEQDAQSAKVRAESHSEEVDSWSSEVSELNAKASSSIETFDTSRENYDEFLGDARDRYLEYMGRVEGLLQNATGASLFSAFEQKKKSFSKISLAWGALSIISIAVAILFAFWLVGSISGDVDPGGPEMWVKLSISPLFLLLIGFCSTQYARSKRTEDEYAFKSTLSLSLEPYRDLVSKMNDDDFAESHMEFVVDMIREIYSSPYDLSSSKSMDKIDAKIDKRIADLLLKVAKRQAGITETDS